MKNIIRSSTRLLLFASVIVVALLPMSAFGAGASLDMFPDTGAVSVDSVIPVGIFLTSTGQPVNAISATISFPMDKLEVVAIDSSDSILDFWIEQPSYSNETGIVKFSGIAFNPGFTGQAGNLLVVRFRAKAEGSAEVRFVSNLILANDGRGTQVEVIALGSSSIDISAGMPVSDTILGTLPEDTLTGALRNTRSLHVLGKDITYFEALSSLLAVIALLIACYNARGIKRIKDVSLEGINHPDGYHHLGHLRWKVDNKPRTD